MLCIWFLRLAFDGRRLHSLSVGLDTVEICSDKQNQHSHSAGINVEGCSPDDRRAVRPPQPSSVNFWSDAVLLSLASKMQVFFPIPCKEVMIVHNT